MAMSLARQVELMELDRLQQPPTRAAPRALLPALAPRPALPAPQPLLALPARCTRLLRQPSLHHRPVAWALR